MAYVYKSGKTHRFQYTDWQGRRRTATGTESEKETRALATRIEREHLEIRRGWRPAPTSALRHAKRPFPEVRDEYLAWGESQGGRGGRPWGRDHGHKRRVHLAWWGERLGLDVLADLGGILPRVEEALRELQAGGLTGKTVSNRVEGLRAFCAWCIGRGYLAAGAQVKEAQSLARHATPTMTMNVYGRADGGRLADLTEAVGEAVLGVSEDPECTESAARLASGAESLDLTMPYGNEVRGSSPLSSTRPLWGPCDHACFALPPPLSSGRSL